MTPSNEELQQLVDENPDNPLVEMFARSLSAQVAANAERRERARQRTLEWARRKAEEDPDW
jgi:hypothetical protein